MKDLLFHYHFWTPFLEETEKFYTEKGFRITLRTGKLDGEFQTFNPPLTWDDFREKKILFRIIEARKGKVNITFGYGKKVMFDHIGYLVSKEEHHLICSSAKELGWELNMNERRTFINSPYGFRIELQLNQDAVEREAFPRINELVLALKKSGLESDLEKLLGSINSGICSYLSEEVTLTKAVIEGSSIGKDPNGVEVTGEAG
ncbi:hypothetical protein [Metabacillus sp. RGM 3146]|uniref:hypothetical protein n=1 Tax=Metabacillus sp. RGM 3146 TaxID=3401092 RepID=UPI003B9AE6E3